MCCGASPTQAPEVTGSTRQTWRECAAQPPRRAPGYAQAAAPAPKQSLSKGAQLVQRQSPDRALSKVQSCVAGCPPMVLSAPRMSATPSGEGQACYTLQVAPCKWHHRYWPGMLHAAEATVGFSKSTLFRSSPEAQRAGEACSATDCDVQSQVPRRQSSKGRRTTSLRRACKRAGTASPAA
jgi:hypothetical protein